MGKSSDWVRWAVGAFVGLVVLSALLGDDERDESSTRPGSLTGPGGNGSSASKPQAGAKGTRKRKSSKRTKPDRKPDAPEAAAGVPPGAKSATVRKVSDGDTVKLSGLGSARLIGIDTPEVFFGAECYGEEASAFTKSKLGIGSRVYFKYDVERKDRYNRDLVYVWLAGGQFFNALLAEKGYAVPLTIPPNVTYAELFRERAAEARRRDRGLWDSSTCNGNADKPAGGSGGGGGASNGGGGGSSGGGKGCEPGYDPCVPSYPPDLDCADVDGPVRVTGSDPHGLDADGDGSGCE